MKKGKSAEELRHDTKMLLQKYRQVKWALEVSSQQALRELQQRTGKSIDKYLHAAVFAGADISNTSLEGRAQSMERSRKMLALIDESVQFMRRNHPHGEVYYQILYFSYFTPSQISLNAILNELEMCHYPMCKNTLFKYRDDAIRLVGEILWGYDDKESEKILKEIAKGI